MLIEALERMIEIEIEVVPYREYPDRANIVKKTAPENDSKNEEIFARCPVVTDSALKQEES